MSFLKKVSAGVKGAGESAALEAAYIKGKKDGYPHPPEVEEHIEIYRGIREEIPKLRDRVSGMDTCHKELADQEAKFAENLQEFFDIPMQHPQLSSVYKVYAEGKNRTSSKRYLLQALLHEIKDEWKPMESENLHDIKSKQDKANRTASDLHYYKKNNKTAQVADCEQKYEILSMELIDLIHILRVKKEGQIPAFLMRIAQAEADFFTEAAETARAVADQIRAIGRVEPQPNTFGSMGQNYNPEPQYSPVPVQQQGPPPVNRPQSTGPQAQGLYAFNAESPQELSFQPGDVMNILSQQGDWWTAEINGRQGLIPANYVQLL